MVYAAGEPDHCAGRARYGTGGVSHCLWGPYPIPSHSQGRRTNGHPVGALRRLRRTSNNAGIGRKLVTNVVLQFIGALRWDACRSVEMMKVFMSSKV